jgi:plastocyanin
MRSDGPAQNDHWKELRMSRKTLGLLAALVATAAAVAVPAGAVGGAREARGHSVSLSGVRFHPGTLNINRGDSVRWSWNVRESEHNVTFHTVHSRTGSSGSFTVRFNRAGTFSYLCTVHVSEGMRGKIVVR